MRQIFFLIVLMVLGALAIQAGLLTPLMPWLIEHAPASGLSDEQIRAAADPANFSLGVLAGHILELPSPWGQLILYGGFFVVVFVVAGTIWSLTWRTLGWLRDMLT